MSKPDIIDDSTAVCGDRGNGEGDRCSATPMRGSKRCRLHGGTVATVERYGSRAPRWDHIVEPPSSTASALGSHEGALRMLDLVAARIAERIADAATPSLRARIAFVLAEAQQLGDEDPAAGLAHAIEGIGTLLHSHRQEDGAIRDLAACATRTSEAVARLHRDEARRGLDPEQSRAFVRRVGEIVAEVVKSPDAAEKITARALETLDALQPPKALPVKSA